MPPRIRPKIEPAERVALDEARMTFLYFDGDDEPQRARFTDLRQATVDLDKALAPFLADGPERTRLLYWLQHLDPQLRPQLDHLDRLVELLPVLQALTLACAAEVGHGRAADARTQRWIYVAADTWWRRLDKLPSYAETGDFYRALHAYGLEHADVPQVSASQLKTALQALQE